MTNTVQALWAAALANPGQPIELGRTVVCDLCNQDYSDSKAEGGFIFGSYAYCPSCAERWLPEIERLGEAHWIRARCPEGVTFADFVRTYRGPNSTITVAVSPAAEPLPQEHDYGPCCACGGSGPTVRNLICLNIEGPPGFVGWGCLQCGAPHRGAMAILCDPCAESGAEPRFICGGTYITERVRVPLDGFARKPFGHDMSKHPEVAHA